MPLPPWAEGPFELIFHAELHLRAGEDFDRRIAMIGFDNAIEVAITTYLSLHPMHRGGLAYPTADVQQWLNNYHTKIDFFEAECGRRTIGMVIEKGYIIWYHQIRNEQYHRGGNSTPNLSDLRGIRQAALWVFSVLYDVPDPEAILAERIAAVSPPPPPQREERLDRVIDNTHGLVEIAGNYYYASEILFGIDADLYREMGLELLNQPIDEGQHA
jgi:hypothetical protein